MNTLPSLQQAHFRFKDAVYAVRKRGELMNEAVPAGEGAMAAILGLDKAALEEVTKEVTESGHLCRAR
ncbi:hypothetical protein BsIDN1_28940 [Bacillus safensis]|uniref:Uncharacterized protein n=1 Tax=Bacillus safensis TaxID=561879 RepID=A0A5S9MCK0_BACIA|nr:hypothetical protein BsIDN1_28940 [Bacillus safensis]